MKKQYLIFLLFVCFCLIAKAQNSKTDSLLQLLNKTVEDTSKVMLYWKTGFSVIYQNPPDALPYFKKGMVLAKKLNFNRGLERCYAATSTTYAFIGQYDLQLVYIDTAIYYALKVGDKDRLALVYLNRADALDNLQNFSAALKNCDTALTFAEKTGNKDRLGRIHYIMGDIFIAQEQYSQAAANLDKAEFFFKQVPNMQMIGLCYSNRGAIYMKTNKYNDAVIFYEKAIQTAESVNDVSNLSGYTSQLAVLYAKQKKLPQAASMAQRSLAYAKETGNLMQESVIHDIFCNIYREQKNYPKAIAEELQAYKILDENNEFQRKITTASTLAEVYELSGNITEAYKFLKISRDLNDSLVKQQFNDETAKLQTKFEVAQKNKEIQLLNKDKELQQQKLQQQQLLMIAAAAVVLLLLVGVWLLMNRNKLRQRMKVLELRGKIAADLHDEVGSTLSSIRMYSNIVNSQVKETNPQSTVLLDKISSNSKEMIENMSDIVWMIKPGNDDFKNIGNRMLNFANELCAPAGINFEFNKDAATDAIQISMEQRRDIYLIFKEAVNNAVKYSGCHSIHAAIILQNQQLQMQISDDGNGFDATNAEKGNGLSNMQKRAATHKGTFTINSAEGEGTEIVVSFPV